MPADRVVPVTEAFAAVLRRVGAETARQLGGATRSGARRLPWIIGAAAAQPTPTRTTTTTTRPTTSATPTTTGANDVVVDHPKVVTGDKTCPNLVTVAVISTDGGRFDAPHCEVSVSLDEGSSRDRAGHWPVLEITTGKEQAGVDLCSPMWTLMRIAFGKLPDA